MLIIKRRPSPIDGPIKLVDWTVGGVSVTPFIFSF